MFRGGSAPAAPHVTVGGFDGAGKGGFVEKRRCFHAGSERGSYFRERREIGGKSDSRGDVVLGGLSGELGEANIGQEGETDAAHVQIADQGDDGNSHPKRFAGRGSSVIGKGVQGDVDFVIEREMSGGGFDAFTKINALGIDLGFGKEREETISCGGRLEGVILEKEFGGGNALKDRRPRLNHLRSDFWKDIERAKGDVPRGEGRQWADGRRDRIGAKIEERVGEADERFSVERIGDSRWIDDRVGEAVIDGGNAGRIGMSEVSDLDGSELCGESEETIAGGMACEVDKDIDLIGTDGLGELVGIEFRRVAPMVRQGLETSGDGIGMSGVGIAK